ncbi:MAG: Gfo/Idh/MocA family oxidoreductase [Clostridia bacterium]|nr:Gfo/Idh/MocA family oxidoreductase [Clostridia bacterium]
MNFAMVGYGYWGRILLKAFNDSNKHRVTHLADRNIDKLLQAKSIYPDIAIFTNIDDIAFNGDVDAVIISLPAIYHFNYAKLCLENGKHVLIEKPMTLTYNEAYELNELAQNLNLVLMVNHHFIYKDAIRSVKQHIPSSVGKLQYFDSTRTNLGIFRTDVDVVLDLAPHDISILLYLAEKLPESVSAIAKANVVPNRNDIAYITLYFDDFMAHINVSWISAFKNRTIIFGCENGTICFDDNKSTEKLTISPVRYVRNNGKIECIKNEALITENDTSNALINVIDEFASAIETGRQPISNGEFGMAVALIIDAIQASIAKDGIIIKL